MKRKIIQTSCSELLVDTAIYEPEVAYKKFKELFKEMKWSSSPKLSIGLLKKLKNHHIAQTANTLKEGEEHECVITVFDGEGNRVLLEYGHNGYLETGFRFDSRCNDWDEKCYPIFQAAIKRLKGELISCDGGHTAGYEDWAGKQKEKKNEDAGS